MLKSVVLYSNDSRSDVGAVLGRFGGDESREKVPRKVLTTCRICYIIVLCCGRIARRVCCAFGRRHEQYGLHSRQLFSRGSTSDTLQRHVLSEDNISVSVWRVFQPSRVSPESRCAGFGVLLILFYDLLERNNY